jgi:hypothetical protein
MTIDPKQPTFGPANIEHWVETDFAQESDRTERARVTRLEVRCSTGLWQVTRDGKFHGHYDADQSAFDAAEAVALDVVANGGAADLWWNDLRPQSEESDPTTGVASRGVSRTIEFRSGSTRIVR